MDFLEQIPQDFINFILVAIFALLIGLEQRRHHLNEKMESLYGTDRTYTFIGVLGFILYVISPNNLSAFLAGGLGLAVLLGIFYWKRIELRNQFGITSIVIVFITYSIAPLLYTKPLWLSILLVTTVLIFTELKPQFRALSQRLDNNEFTTLAKFLVIAGIVLPLLPRTDISSFIPISAFKIWLAVVIISGISYISYLLQKFLFPKSGIILTGFLGGLYSSTATTIVLAKKSKAGNIGTNQITTAIFVATAMMFIRIFIIAYIFNSALALHFWIPFTVLSLFSFSIAALMYFFSAKGKETDLNNLPHNNPLEFKTAVLFAILFVVFALITKYVLEYYGAKGLNILSLVVGVTDIDPFLIALFTGKYQIGMEIITQASLIAITSNNFIKTIYALSLGHAKIRKPILLGFLSLIIISVFLIIF
ncbi:MAG: DUF4010 domain-containing protein [Bacteroidales bacterium]|nr:DUF4010 domain-containing protein [Bacteroidales bacterium]